MNGYHFAGRDNAPVSDAADPSADNPVEALMRHNITVHNSTQTRFLHNLMQIVTVGAGAALMVTSVVSIVKGELTVALPTLVGGLFLVVWGPFARRQVAADTARESAAAQWQLDQWKAARLREERDL